MHVNLDLTAEPPAASLEEPDDFGSFKVVVLDDGEHRDQVGEALGGVGRLADDGDAYVDIDAVKRLAGERAQDAEWSANLEKMVAYAGSKGWLDDAGEAIQAHLEWLMPRG